MVDEEPLNMNRLPVIAQFEPEAYPSTATESLTLCRQGTIAENPCKLQENPSHEQMSFPLLRCMGLGFCGLRPEFALAAMPGVPESDLEFWV